MNTNQFSQMDLSDELKRAVEDMGFEEATSIQAASIPLILSGKDVIGHSKTGTGKTAAFSLPAIEKIDLRNRNIQVLILCPTRELAVQACDEIKKFAKYLPAVRAIPVYGGQQIERQFAALRQNPQIVVGTPGRIMDHMRRGTLRLENLKIVILDEADEMLSMGFREDIETILQDVPDDRQTILFSATMSPEILEITRQYQRDPELIKIVHEQLTVPDTEQLYYEIPLGKKVEVLSRLLDVYNPGRSMVFCNTKSQVNELVSELQVRGYMVGGLHGDMKQADRTNIMNQFKAGRIDILVATDVAARGIDVDNIEAVFNYDIPQDVEYYVHRIGRTGRAGKSGRSFTFVSGRRQIYELRDIQRFTKAKIELRPIPSSNEVIETKSRKFIDQVKSVIADGSLEHYNKIVDVLLEDHSTLEISTALIKMLFGKDGSELNQSKLDDMLFEAEIQKVGSPERDRKRLVTPRKESKRPRSSPARRSDDKNMVPIVISIGRNARVAANHILGAIAGETGLSGKVFGRIEILEDRTIVGVPAEYADTVLTSMKGCKILGRKTFAKRA